MQNTTEFDDYIDEATTTLKEMGITVRWGNDFNVFERIISRHDERSAPGLGFRPEYNHPDRLDGVWLVAYRGAGELVHTQACRRVSILPDMRTHLQTGATAYETETFKFDLDRLEVNLSPEAAKMKGDAIYHGEAWLKGGPGGIRGGLALCIFSRMMIARALSLWDVEHIYGLIPPFPGIKGLPQRYGYTRCEQGAVTFLDRTTFPNDLWFVWMTTAEAQSQLRLKPRYFEEMLAPPKEAAVSKVA